MKQCRLCGTEKPLTEFHKQSKAKDGHQSRCKECAIALAHDWYQANKERALTRQRDKRLAESEDERLARLEYAKDYYRANGERWATTPEQIEHRKLVRARLAATPEAKARKSEWYRAYYERGGRERYIVNARRRRDRLADADRFEFTARDWDRLIARQGGCCFLCGERKPLTREHLVPLSRGGTHSVGNIVAACKSCNCSKGDKFLMEFRVWRARRLAVA